MRKAVDIHHYMITFGLMHDLFVDSSVIGLPEDDDVFPLFGRFGGRLVRFDDCGFTVPIFTKFLKGHEGGRECIICMETLREIDFSTGGWVRFSLRVAGPWMSKLNPFPTKEEQTCEHSLDVCKSCFEKYLDERVTETARNPVCSFSCPQCSRKLERSEFEALASNSTLEK
jgi:hypothetical protein